MIIDPEISIILPFYNAEKTLERALKSISDQSFEKFECILVNNNSTDKSIEIATSFCSMDKRFSLTHEKQQGVVYAHNHGMKIVKGKYIARMDADDVSLPDRLFHQYSFLQEHQEYGMVAGLATYIPHKTKADGFKRYVNWSNGILEYNDILLNQFVESPIINPTVMWRKEISDRFGTYAKGDFPEDYELWLRWIEKGVKIHKLPEVLIEWHDSENRLTRTDVSYSDEAFFSIKTQYLLKWLKNHNPFHPAVYVWGASKISRKRAQILETHGIQIEGYIDISTKRQLDKEVLYYKNIPSHKEIFVLVYLKEEIMRERTRQFLEQRGFVEGKNYLMVS